MVADSVSSGQPGLRAAQVGATRTRLLDAAVRVIEAGHEPTMRGIAREAGVGERTIYRYFPAREQLERAVGERISPRIGAKPPESANGLEAYVERLFGAFAANRELLAAVVSAPWVRKFYPRTRPRNLAAFERLLEEAFPEVPPGERRAVAASLRVPLSGEGWTYLVDCGWSDDEVLEQGRWLVRHALDTLKRAQQRERRRAQRSE